MFSSQESTATMLARARSHARGREAPAVAPWKPRVGCQRICCVNWNVLRMKGSRENCAWTTGVNKNWPVTQLMKGM